MDYCKLDDFVLLTEKVGTSVDRSIVEHSFPYRDGAELEDMGSGARKITLRCWFFDDGVQNADTGNYNGAMIDYKQFFDYVSTRNPDGYTLKHPVYGDIHGQIKNVVDDSSNEFDNAVSVDITFVEELKNGFVPLNARIPAVAANVIAAWNDGQEEVMEEIAADAADSFGVDAAEFIDKVLTDGVNISLQFIDAALDARTKLQAIDAAITKAGTVLTLFTVAADECVSLFEYPSTIPGRIASTFGMACARYAESLHNLIDSPEQFISNLNNLYSDFIDSFNDDAPGAFPIKKTVTIVCAQSLALYTAMRYDEDAQRGAALSQTETAVAFDAAGNWLNPPAVPVIMTIDGLENTLASVRKNIQNAVSMARTVQSLKQMALELLLHVDFVRLDREKIIIVDILSETPLYLILQQYGLPYTYAPRVLAINPTIEHAMFVIGKVRLYAK